MDSGFAQESYLSFLFAFAVPSETLCLIGAYSDFPLDTFSPQLEEALLGYELSMGGDSFSRNWPTGRISLRVVSPDALLLRVACSAGALALPGSRHVARSPPSGGARGSVV